MSSSDSWTLIGLTILVVLLLFYLSKKMICGSNGNSGDSVGGGGDWSGRNSISTGHHQHHQQNHQAYTNQDYFEEDISPDAYHSLCSGYSPTTDPDNPHQDQNSEHRLNLDYNSNQQIGEDVIMNRPYYYYPHHHYHNLPHYPSQSVSLRELLEICSRSSVGTANNQHTSSTPTTTITTTPPGNYSTNTSPSDNQPCHDPSIDTNNATATDSGLVEVSVISDSASTSTPQYRQVDNEPISSPTTTTTIKLTERKKQLIEKQLRTQIVRMVQAEREVRRLAHLLSLQQGRGESAAAATIERTHEPYYISEERPSSPNNSLLHSHHPNYSGHNEVILSAHALSSRYSHHLIQGRSDHYQVHHHHHNHHLYQHPPGTLAEESNSVALQVVEDNEENSEMPPPPYEDCVSSSPS